MEDPKVINIQFNPVNGLFWHLKNKRAPRVRIIGILHTYFETGFVEVRLISEIDLKEGYYPSQPGTEETISFEHVYDEHGNSFEEGNSIYKIG